MSNNINYKFMKQRTEEMEANTKWQYNEMKFSGVDFSSVEEVAAYDSMHRKFRDYEKGTEEILRRLGIGADATIIDLGSGTGAFALNAARRCKLIYAVDISPAMIDYCRQEAENKGLSNIIFSQAGLLTYEHKGEPADAAVCVAVLHHLPDFWKLKALRRIREMLKPGGRFLLFDIVFPSIEPELDRKIDEFIKIMEVKVGQRMAEESAIHIRDEFSTYDWIMEGLLRECGFQIDVAEYGRGFQTTYICTKD
jgi:putative AdoMet-dependent methyltransferase